MRLLARTLCVTFAALAVPISGAAGLVMVRASGAAGDSESVSVPLPLHGSSDVGATHLRLVVAGRSAVVLDAGTGRSIPVSGIRNVGALGAGASRVGRSAILWVPQTAKAGAISGSIYVIAPGSTRARLAARNVSSFASGPGGNSILLRVNRSASECVLRNVDLEGRQLQRSTPIDCGAVLVDSGVGLAKMTRDSIVDAETGQVLATGTTIVAGDGFVLSESADSPTARLFNILTKRAVNVRLPPRAVGLPSAVYSAPGSRDVVVELGDPSFGGTGTQVIDLWRVDRKTGRVRRLDGVPAAVDLKSTSGALLPDGRFVMVSRSGGRIVFAEWPTLKSKIAVKSLALDEGASGLSIAIN